FYPLYFCFLLIRPPPSATLFPYTTLFRSVGGRPSTSARCRSAIIHMLSPCSTTTLSDSRGASAAGGAGVRSAVGGEGRRSGPAGDRKSTRLNSSHVKISYAVFCLKKKKKQ